MPNSTLFNLKIQSPIKEVFSGLVESILFESDAGQMEIYFGHSSFAGTINYSPLIVYKSDKNYRFHIKRGIIFYSNTNNEASISAYEAILEEEVDFANVQEYLDFIEDRMKSKEDVDSYEYKFLENEKLAIVRRLETRSE